MCYADASDQKWDETSVGEDGARGGGGGGIVVSTYFICLLVSYRQFVSRRLTYSNVCL